MVNYALKYYKYWGGSDNVRNVYYLNLILVLL